MRVMNWKSLLSPILTRGASSVARTIDSDSIKLATHLAMSTGDTEKSPISASHLDEVALAFQRNDRAPWEGRSLEVPCWFDFEAKHDSPAYKAQVLRLWEEITALTDYDPAQHEDTPEIGALDAIFRPGFYATGDAELAGGHLIAMGHILKRSGIRTGDRVLEYGAGFGQTALAFARLGAKVDTVDINPAFCNAVQSNGHHFGVDLTAHLGQFGDNPAGTPNAYDLILFYESFHHCLDFEMMIANFSKLLKPNGRVLLAGEPIFDGACPAMPYGWGPRLDWECVAVMRIRGWMELGFQKDFLLQQFSKAGFDCTIHTDPNSHWAQVYEFRQERPPESSQATVAI